jgi:chromosome segregation ATPase
VTGDTARERAEAVLRFDARQPSRREYNQLEMEESARDVLALLAERDELKRDLHFSETMHQADLDERVKIEKDCRALRERVAAAEKEAAHFKSANLSIHKHSKWNADRVATLEEALRLIFDNSEFLQVRLQHLVNDKVFREASALACVPVAEEETK